MWQDTMVNVAYAPRPQRAAYDVPVRLRHGSKRQVLMLRNISALGGRLDGAKGIDLGDVALLQLPTLAPKAARVVWVRPGAMGLEFERPLHSEIFDGVLENHAHSRPRTIADLEPEPHERPALLPRAA